VSTFVAKRFRGLDPAAPAPDWPCQGEVIVGLPYARVAPYVHDGIVEPLGSGQCRLRQGSWSWTSLALSIARFDAGVEVFGPAELEDTFRCLAERLGRIAAASSIK